MQPEMAVVPPGGYKFHQRLPNGSMQLFVGVSYDDLLNQVRTFRTNNNIQEGDLEQEIKQGISRPSHSARLPDQRSLRERVTGWAANRMYQKLGFVSPEESERRASICVDCPFNNAKYADDCLECYSHVEQQLLAMRQGKSTSHDTWLGACSVCGHENKTAVQLLSDNLLHRNNFKSELVAKAPHCWLLQLDSSESKEVG